MHWMPQNPQQRTGNLEVRRFNSMGNSGKGWMWRNDSIANANGQHQIELKSIATTELKKL